MRSRGTTTILALAIAGLLGTSTFADTTAEANWPTWRGPHANGVAVQGNPPVTWSETENIKWKVAMPDAGECTPVVWGDKMFIQTAVAIKKDTEAKVPQRGTVDREIFTAIPTVPYKFSVVCLDRRNGQTIWEKTVREEVPHEGFHPSGSLASYSPVTDGEHLWVSFGSRGMYCLDLDGNLIWEQDLPDMLTFRAFGEGSSPALAGDAVIVVVDHEGDSKIFAFDRKTGEPRWEKDRDEGTTWATPVVAEVNGKIQVITSGTNVIRSYDLETGDIVWQASGLTKGAIASPVLGFGRVYCMTGFEGPRLLAIELGYRGDLTDSDAIAWHAEANTPYIPSPVLYDDRLYVLAHMKPILSCYNAETGEVLFEGQRLKGLKQLYASPVGAGGRLYIAGRGGTTVVVKHSDEFEVLATNTLDDGFDSSPVVVGDELYLKGEHYLYCIAED